MDNASNSASGIRRSSLLYGAIIVIGTIFVLRLFYLQVIRHDFYKQEALSEHQSKFDIPAERGVIYALDGDQETPLVLNEVLPTVYADPRYIDDPDEVARVVSEILGTEESDYRELLDTDSAYVVLEKKIPFKKAKRIEKAEIKGVGLVDESYRVYPQGQLASQVVGFVNHEGVGQYGIEAKNDEDLRGEDGKLKAITDIYGIPLTTNDSNIVKDAVNGDNLTLTIDVNIQREIENVLKKATEHNGAKSASAIVMDPHTGEVKAMANYPTFDPGKFAEIKDYSRFSNPVIDAPYETGSGMKVFSMATGLSEGAVKKGSTYLDKGAVTVDGHVIKNAAGVSGVVRTMEDVIRGSVNTGVVHVLQQLGGGDINEKARNTLHDYYTKKFGFGSLTGIELSNEATGLITEPTTGAGDNIRYANMTFGQGLSVTMLQMSAALSSIINGGTYYQPHVVHSVSDANGREYATKPNAIRKNVVKKSVSKDIKEMMRAVIAEGSGYAANRPGYFIGGKTGTAQIPDEFGGYKTNSFIGSLIGFGGSKKIDYVLMVRIDEPKTGGFAGSDVAGPIFAEINNWLIDYYHIPPNS